MNYETFLGIRGIVTGLFLFFLTATAEIGSISFVQMLLSTFVDCFTYMLGIVTLQENKGED